MNRIITVNGNAKMTVQPDYITVVIRLEERNKEYQKAINGLFDRVNALSRCAEAVGLPKEDIQTDEFMVHVNRRTEKDRKGNYKEINDGYAAVQSISIGFSKDMAVLSNLIQAVSAEIAKPNIQIHYSVKDPGKLSTELLQKLSVDAYNKATMICESSGGALGKLMNVDYRWNDLKSTTTVSPTLLMDDTTEVLPMMESPLPMPQFKPKEIELEENAMFIWEITDKA